MLWRVINFADRNPQAALLEGSEFLMHERMVHSSKSSAVLPLSEIEPVQPEPIEGPDANPEIAEIPDEDVFFSENEGGQE